MELKEIWGIDVSEHNGTVDFVTMKEDGFDFVIIRAGYGRYYTDPKFYENYKKAKEAGLKVGAYWFSYATDESKAIEEAHYCYNVVKSCQLDLPVFFDYEYDSVRYADDNGVTVTKQKVENWTAKFCDVIREYGISSGFYFNYDFYCEYYYDLCEVDNTNYKWYAQYTNPNDPLVPTNHFDLIQYTSKPFDKNYSNSKVFLDLFKEEEIPVGDYEDRIYNSVEDCPDWAKDAIQYMVDNKYILGVGGGKLALTYDMLRIYVTLYRAGVI